MQAMLEQAPESLARPQILYPQGAPGLAAVARPGRGLQRHPHESIVSRGPDTPILQRYHIRSRNVLIQSRQYRAIHAR